MDTAQLVQQLPDARGHKVVFVAHCLLNQNTRYLGGAFRRAAADDEVQRWLSAGVGIVQLPCPEQVVWGGVLKRHLWALYGRGAPARGLARLALPYVRWRYRQLARRVARQIHDYQRSGYEVAGVVGVDPSPTCGVAATIDARGFIDEASRLDLAHLSTATHNALVQRHARPGQGLFVAELRRALLRRHLDVPWLSHDLFLEAKETE